MTALIFLALLFFVCAVSAIVVHDFDCAANGPPIPRGTTDLRLRLHGVCRADQLVFLGLDNLEVVGPATVLGPLPHMDIRNMLVLRDLFFDGQGTYANMFYDSGLDYNLLMSHVNVTGFHSEYVIVAVESLMGFSVKLDNIRAYGMPGGLAWIEADCVSVASCSSDMKDAYDDIDFLHIELFSSRCLSMDVFENNSVTGLHGDHSHGFDITQRPTLSDHQKWSNIDDFNGRGVADALAEWRNMVACQTNCVFEHKIKVECPPCQCSFNEPVAICDCLVEDSATPATDGFGSTIFNTTASALAGCAKDIICVRMSSKSAYFESL